MADVSTFLISCLAVAGSAAALSIDAEVVARVLPDAQTPEAKIAASAHEPRTLKSRIGPDGRLYIVAVIGDERVDFLLDTAATHSAISRADAAQFGIPIGQPTRVLTAGGMVEANFGIIPKLTVDEVSAQDEMVLIFPELDQPLLGMRTVRMLNRVGIQFHN